MDKTEILNISERTYTYIKMPFAQRALEDIFKSRIVLLPFYG